MHSLRYFIFSFALLLLFLLLFAEVGAQPADAQLFPIECPFPLPEGQLEGQTLTCGVMVVPENYNNPAGAEVEIAYAILYSTGTTYRNDPVIYLMGGPGGSTLMEVELWIQSAFLQERDLILFDQRGTGFSYPRLHCPEVDALEDMDEDDVLDVDVALLEAYQECQDFYRTNGVDLSQYNTINNARDMADLMRLLAEEKGYDGFNLFGISYGTRLALEAMRSHPQDIRAVIIDAVYPTNVLSYEEGPINTYRVLNQIFAGCAADATCNAAFPNLEARFYAALDRLTDAPADLGEFGELTGEDFIGELFSLAYDSFALPYLPLLIDRTISGDYSVLLAVFEDDLLDTVLDEEGLAEEFADLFYFFADDLDDDDYYALFDEMMEIEEIDDLYDLIDFYFPPDDADELLDLLDEMTDQEIFLAYQLIMEGDLSDSEGMFYSVECREEVPFNDIAQLQARAQAAGVPQVIIDFELISYQFLLEICAIWDVGVAPSSFREPVFSDIPTLVFNGLYDPVTPPGWGAIAAQTLTNSYLFDLPNIGHGATDIPELPCATQIALSFLNNPQVAPDASCIAEQSIRFATTLD